MVSLAILRRDLSDIDWLRVAVAAVPHFDRSADALENANIDNERLKGQCDLDPKSQKRGGSCPTTGPKLQKNCCAAVAGVTNAPPYTYSFNTTFASAPTVAHMQMAGVDGGNGGWAQVHGATVATTTDLFLSIDEDQIRDTERDHTTEQVAYVVFSGPVVYTPGP